MKKNLKSLILMLLVGVMILGLVGCGNTKSVTTNAKAPNVEDQLKNTIIEGNLTTEEKSKSVELATKMAEIGINTDYTKVTLDTVKESLKYTTDDILEQFPDDILQKMVDGTKVAKEIIKFEGITFNKISKDAEGNITVECTIKAHVVSHIDTNLNGKTFEKITAKYVINKDWKVSAFAISDYQ